MRRDRGERENEKGERERVKRKANIWPRYHNQTSVSTLQFFLKQIQTETKSYEECLSRREKPKHKQTLRERTNNLENISSFLKLQENGESLYGNGY